MTSTPSRQSPRPSPPLSAAIALVTGATAYIGRAIALELARRGAHVVVSGRNAAAGQAVANEIAATGGRAEFAAADLTDRAAVQALVGGIVQRHGRLDVLAASGAGASSDSLAFKLFMDIQQAVNLRIYERFEAEGIQFAYPGHLGITPPRRPDV